MSFELLARAMNPWWSDETARKGYGIRPRRNVQVRLWNAIFRPDRRALVLIGPRQVGKTVALYQCIDDLLDTGFPGANVSYFDFSDDRIVEAITPRMIAEFVPPEANRDLPRYLYFDEIGKGSRWAEWLKRAVDDEKNRYVVTDSAATLLRGGRESGVGRWDEIRVEPLTYSEFLNLQARPAEPISEVAARLPDPLDAYLSHGGFPEHVFSSSPDLVHQRLRTDIVERAILRDLLPSGIDTGRVRDLFVYLVSDSGAAFDARARSRLLTREGSAPPDPRSVAKWLDLLEETMLITRLEPLATSASARLSAKQHPRFYACDSSLVIAFAGVADPLRDPGVRAKAVETAVFRALREAEGSVTFARSHSGRGEIDFVISRGRKRVAIEVTISREVAAKAEQLEAAMKPVGATRGLVIYGGLDVIRADQVTQVPLHDFLLSPAEWVNG